MFCTKCSAENPEEAKFCRQCGSPISKDSAHLSLTNETRGWSTGKMTLWVILTLVFPIVGLILGGGNLKNPARKKQAKKLLILGIFVAVLSTIFVIVAAN